MNNDINQSEEHAKRIGYLVAGFINETLTPEEHDELDRWVEESEANMMLFEELTDEKNIEEGLRNLRRRKQKKKYTEILKRISINPEKRGYQIWPYAVAASLILIAVSIYLLLPSKENEVSNT
ncbi:MAG: hypothetical protein H0V91_02075, partial [Flavisolibacter sp.]|nr:hypothetical protein [Flavisolibacter sp.]